MIKLWENTKDNILWVLFWTFVALFVVALAIDITDGGIGDCSDDPKYCKTNEQLIEQWPQFHQHDDEGNVVVVGEPSKELEEHTH